MKSLSVQHTTVYRYTQPVQFGEHRLMFRPRDSHDMRLLATKLTISPPAKVRWLHDVFGNSIAIASFKRERRGALLRERNQRSSTTGPKATFPSTAVPRLIRSSIRRTSCRTWYHRSNDVIPIPRESSTIG